IWLMVFGYSLLTEGYVPVTRASITLGFLIVGRLLDCGYAVGNSVAGIALIILLVDPRAIEDSGFQMTFVAVVAVVGVGVLAMRGGLGWLREALTQFDDWERDGRIVSEIADWRVARCLWCELHHLLTRMITIPWRAILAVGEVATIALCVEVVFVFFMVE